RGQERTLGRRSRRPPARTFPLTRATSGGSPRPAAARGPSAMRVEARARRVRPQQRSCQRDRPDAPTIGPAEAQFSEKATANAPADLAIADGMGDAERDGMMATHRWAIQGVSWLPLMLAACGSGTLTLDGGPTGTGGTNGVAACQMALAVDRSCTTASDCVAVSHTSNCCGQ